jgi:hypothetical protein
VKDGANIISQIESDEINKIFNLIYNTKTEKIKINDNLIKKHQEIIDYVDNLKKPKNSFFKRLKF